eukprot:TRINITY_DN11472_c0_g1_i3.p2 TRINITY_DN11472_c0_g1~~TRINITY_DN11472_c0_g1_i3.p2  ORF type:complete len:101 (-),score=30.32 TRINITY_DN11472_c0_g1_i3:202-504(-)
MCIRDRYGLWRWKPWQKTKQTRSMPVVYSKCRWEGCAVIQANPFLRDQHEKICDSRAVVHKRCKQKVTVSELEEHKKTCCEASEEVDEIDADDGEINADE